MLCPPLVAPRVCSAAYLHVCTARLTCHALAVARAYGARMYSLRAAGHKCHTLCHVSFCGSVARAPACILCGVPA
jgi:hypothetical protein